MRHDTSHLDAIEDRISREQGRLSLAVAARNASKVGTRAYTKWGTEILYREREIASAKREKASERMFLGMPAIDPVDAMSIDELLAELAK